MAKYYFTYGTDEKFPFQGGWTVVSALTLDLAIRAFKAFHPDRPGSNCTNCAGIYEEDTFLKQEKIMKEGSHGAFCREQIMVVYTMGNTDVNQIHELITYIRQFPVTSEQEG